MVAIRQGSQRRIGEFVRMLDVLWAPDESQPCFSHRSYLGLRQYCSHGHRDMVAFDQCVVSPQLVHRQCGPTGSLLQQRSRHDVQGDLLLGNGMF